MGYLDDIGNAVLGKKKKIDSTNDPSKPQKPPIKVLIVEDEAVLREMYSDKLKHEGFEVYTSANGKHGLEDVQSHNPDIVLLDLMMPVMDGILMLKKLREIPKYKKLPVIVLTNAGDVENIKQAQHYYDANEFLIKSNVSMEEVVNKVKEWTIWGFRSG